MNLVYVVVVKNIKNVVGELLLSLNFLVMTSSAIELVIILLIAAFLILLIDF
jgi:hypothetical protein